MEKTVRKMNSFVESSLKSVQENIENSLDHKLDTMKDYLKKTFFEFVSIFLVNIFISSLIHILIILIF